MESSGGLTAILLGLFSAIAAAAAGGRLLRVVVPDADKDERFALGLPVGLSLLAIIAAAALFAGLPLKWVVPPVMAAAIVAGRSEFGLWFTSIDGPPVFRDLWGGGARRGLFAAAYVALLLGVIGCLAPATGWDTGVYHFTMARLRAVEGWMVVRPDIPHSYRPGYLESLGAMGFAFKGEALASFANLAFWIAGFLVARLWAGRTAGDRARLLAGFAWLGVVTLILRTDGGDVEAALAVCLGLALYALVRLRDGGDGGWRWLAGLGLGMLLGLKYAAAWMVVAVALAWLVVRLRDRASMATLARDAAIVGTTAVAVACPWYIRNFLLTGSAVYPFEAGGLNSLTGGAASSGGARRLVETIALDAVVLLAIPAAFVRAAAKLRWTGAASAAFVLWILWKYGLAEANVQNAWRYGSLAFLPLIVIAAVGLDAWAARGPAARAAAWALVLLPALGGLGVHLARNGPKVPVVLGGDRRAYLESRINSFAVLQRAERLLPEGRRILLVEERAYYCRKPFVVAVGGPGGIGLDGFRTPAEFRGFLERNAIGLVVVNAVEGKTLGFSRMVRQSPGFLADAGVTPRETVRETTLYRVD